MRDRVKELIETMEETPGEHVKRIMAELDMNIRDLEIYTLVPEEKIKRILLDQPTKLTSDESRRLYFFTDIDFDIWIYHEDIMCEGIYRNRKNNDY